MVTVKIGDEEVEIREPNAGSLRGLKLLDVVQMDMDALAELLPRISSIEKEDFYKLKAYEVAEVSVVVAGFFNREA